MNLLDIRLDPDERILRQFGFIALPAFALLAGLAHFRQSLFGFPLGEGAAPVAIALLAAGLLSALFSLVLPRANRALYVALVVLTFPIGFILSFLILGILFFLVLTPVGLVFRLMGRDALRLRREPGATSHWVERSDEPIAVERYFKQF